MTGKELSSESGYAGPTHDDVRHTVRVALVEYEEDRL